MLNMLNAKLEEKADLPYLKLGQRVDKTDKYKYGWKELNTPVSFSKPTVLCFSGTGSCSAEKANGMAKLIQKALGSKDYYSTDYETYSVFYCDFRAFQFERERIISLYEEGALCDSMNSIVKGSLLEYEREKSLTAIKDFYKAYLLPLISKEGGKEALPVDEIKRNLRKVNMIGYSYGSFVVSKLEKFMKESLSSFGFDEKKVKECLSSLFVMTFAPRSILGNSWTQKINCVSQADEILGSNMKETQLSAFLRENEFYKDEFHNLSISENENVFAVQRLSYDARQDEHNISNYLRDDLKGKTPAAKTFTKALRVAMILAMQNSCDTYLGEQRGESYKDFSVLRAFLSGKNKAFPNLSLRIKKATQYGDEVLDSFNIAKEFYQEGSSEALDAILSSSKNLSFSY